LTDPPEVYREKRLFIKFKPPPEPDRFFIIRILIVGSRNVGKTCIARRFTDQVWDHEKIHKEFVEHRTRYHFFDNMRSLVKIYTFDVPCLNRCMMLNTSYQKNVSGNIAIIDLCDRKKTLEEALYWQEMLL
jgi:GTPase SAR1 family protein